MDVALYARRWRRQLVGPDCCRELKMRERRGKIWRLHWFVRLWLEYKWLQYIQYLWRNDWMEAFRLHPISCVPLTGKWRGCWSNVVPAGASTSGSFHFWHIGLEWTQSTKPANYIVKCPDLYLTSWYLYSWSGCHGVASAKSKRCWVYVLLERSSTAPIPQRNQLCHHFKTGRKMLKGQDSAEFKSEMITVDLSGNFWQSCAKASWAVARSIEPVGRGRKLHPFFFFIPLPLRCVRNGEDRWAPRCSKFRSIGQQM